MSTFPCKRWRKTAFELHIAPLHAQISASIDTRGNFDMFGLLRTSIFTYSELSSAADLTKEVPAL
eukprot:1153345-Pelagomonas_calceolata.AAC.3